MATVKGRAVVWSIGGVTFTAGIVSASNPDFPQSLRAARTSDKGEVKTDGGAIVAVGFSGFKKTLSITVVPADLAASASGAITSLDAHTLKPGTTVTVVDGSGAIVDGNYNVISSTQNRTVDGAVTVDLELEAGDEGLDLTAAVS